MGQKVHPTGIRLGITRDWTSKWYAHSKNFPILIRNDHTVREFLKKRLADASVVRSTSSVPLDVSTSRFTRPARAL